MPSSSSTPASKGTLTKTKNLPPSQQPVDPSTVASTQDWSPLEEAKPLVPISPLSTPLARAARHVQPLALAALFAARWHALVRDPVATLAGELLPAAVVLQTAWVVVGVPVAGSQGKQQEKEKGEKEKEKEGVNVKGGKLVVRRGGKKDLSGGEWKGRVLTALLSLLLTTLVTPLLHLSLILFGAPFLTHTSHTALCASVLAVLALFPLFYVRGVDGPSWRALASFAAPLDETFGGLVGTLVGGWLGAVPIPLDWDREWQKWPVTVVTGVWGGYVLGRFVGGTVAWGKRFY